MKLCSFARFVVGHLRKGEPMNNIENYPDCPMRTDIGNCGCGGGFCTSVKAEVCDALHNAYQIAFLHGQRYERERRNDE